MTEYNTEKYRDIQCPQCKKIINSNVYPIPNCSKCNREMYVYIKSVVDNK